MMLMRKAQIYDEKNEVFSHEFLAQFFYLMCDEVADSHDSGGSGISRWVYTSSVFKDLVFKIEQKAGIFQNVIEWETWNTVRDVPAFAKWFAPVVAISPCGRILVMKRTTQLKKEDYPHSLPVFLTDHSYSNYGMYRGHFVCHDYGTNNMQTTGLTEKTRRVTWG